LNVVGTLGVLLRAKRATLVSEIRPLVDAAISEGFHLSPALYQNVLQIAQEDD
jgi:predicted nucleic acid-binding protein